MMTDRKEMRFSDSHEWVAVDGDVATIGVSDHAQEELGDIVFVELPEQGKTIGKGDAAAVLESTKAAADIYAPISGEIIEVNGNLEETSGLINESPEGEGWLFKLRVSNASELDSLMDAAAYEEFIK